jgi:hypothetical protein
MAHPEPAHRAADDHEKEGDCGEGGEKTHFTGDRRDQPARQHAPSHPQEDRSAAGAVVCAGRQVLADRHWGGSAGHPVEADHGAGKGAENAERRAEKRDLGGVAGEIEYLHDREHDDEEHHGREQPKERSNERPANPPRGGFPVDSPPTGRIDRCRAMPC